MRRLNIFTAVLFLLLVVMFSKSNAQSIKPLLLSTGGNPANTNIRSDYPISPVSFTEVKFTDNFFAPRQEIVREVSNPHCMSQWESFDETGGWEVLSGLKPEEKYHGINWSDLDVYRQIEAISYSLATRRDAVMEKRIDDLISMMVKSQEPDGYMNTDLQIRNPDYRHFSDETKHEVSFFGRMFEAAAAYYAVTGKSAFLNVALKAADLICKEQAAGAPALQVSNHPDLEVGLIKLYRITGEKKYLDAANVLVKNMITMSSQSSRSDFHSRIGRDTKRDKYSIAMDGVPFLSEGEITGHAVASSYGFMGALDVAMLTGNEDLVKRVESKWNNLVKSKIYITGATGHKKCYEGYALEYELPNEYAYGEFCSAIGIMLWAHRMFLIKGDAKYMNILERVLYNQFSACLASSGDRFFYESPLVWNSRTDIHSGLFSRYRWDACPCCPPNVCRTYPIIPQFMYAVKEDNLYVNLFVSSFGKVNIKGEEVMLRQNTDYPWNGNMSLTLETKNPVDISLHIRIPDWVEGKPIDSDLYHYINQQAQTVTFMANGKKLEVKLDKGYAVINRKWEYGDKITWEWEMPINLVQANELVKDDSGMVSIERGPIVYCAEGIDNESKVLDLILPDNTRLESKHNTDLFGGVTTIKAEGERLINPRLGPVTTKPTEITLVPYYVWNNRGPSEMSVWQPTTQSKAKYCYDKFMKETRWSY
jgi:uncharacterized protein